MEANSSGEQFTDVPFSGVKVFSATKSQDRVRLGEVVTQWLTAHPRVEIVDKHVRQSSDEGFHCLSVTLFYRQRDDVPPNGGPVATDPRT